MKHFEYCVVGLGSIGVLTYYFLRDMHPLAVTRRIDAPKEIEVDLLWHGRTVFKSRVAAYPPDWDFECRKAIVAVKAYDLERTLTQISSKVESAVLLQNGIGIREMALRILGEDRLVRAIVTYGAVKRGEFSSELRSEGKYYIGVYSRSAMEAASRLAGDLAGGGANVELVEDIQGFEWLKLVVNAAINPLTALLRASNRVVVESEHAWRVAVMAAEEVVAVAKKLGVKLPVDDPIAYLRHAAEAFKENVSSMAQDVASGRRTEIDFINGAVVRLARSVGVPARVNETLYNMIKVIEENSTVLHDTRWHG